MTSYVAFNFKRSCGFVAGLHLVAVCLVATAVLAASACVGQVPDSGEDTAEAAQALAGVAKYCDAVSSGGVHDTFPVLADETIAGCASDAHSVGDSDYRVGCILDNGSFSWGALHNEPFGAGLPDPNCGWSCVANIGHLCSSPLICRCGRFTTPAPGEIDCEGKCIAVENCGEVCGSPL